MPFEIYQNSGLLEVSSTIAAFSYTAAVTCSMPWLCSVVDADAKLTQAAEKRCPTLMLENLGSMRLTANVHGSLKVGAVGQL